jgi:hypothetical protein
MGPYTNDLDDFFGLSEPWLLDFDDVAEVLLLRIRIRLLNQNSVPQLAKPGANPMASKFTTTMPA